MCPAVLSRSCCPGKISYQDLDNVTDPYNWAWRVIQEQLSTLRSVSFLRLHPRDFNNGQVSAIGSHRL